MNGRNAIADCCLDNDFPRKEEKMTDLVIAGDDSIRRLWMATFHCGRLIRIAVAVERRLWSRTVAMVQ